MWFKGVKSFIKIIYVSKNLIHAVFTESIKGQVYFTKTKKLIYTKS